ncbi:flavin reductase family protein [Paenarthrobacter sp. PH39-S1]|uniref:flavin reductase family protein n=1 Tax=Paenarthrobacter sp. PH39-S1 TaxID=3046204 RepID=UPI0024BA062B|nr:flavin reductase family protein [Paenarthrobacter sp. PH39-S1]MDJ0357239.1 flavin reductase family protein [Paenarthrobacter sp. PH39-S1]
MTAQPGILAGPLVAANFKAAFGNHPAGVAIVTARGVAGPVGLTASSVASVSAEPPVLSFSLSSRTGSAAEIAAAETFVVHLLTADNLALARIFARSSSGSSGSGRFTGTMNWKWLETGEPLLLDASRALRCRVLSRTPAGDSVLIAASVLDIHYGAAVGSPLVYHSRTFHALGAGSVL